MNVILVVSFSCALTLVAFALAREFRWRKALEGVLRNLLAYWRRPNENSPSESSRVSRDD